MRDEEKDEIQEEANKVKSYDEALIYIKEPKTFSKDDYVAFEQVKNLECHFQKCREEAKQRKLKQSTILTFFQTASK